MPLEPLIFLNERIFATYPERPDISLCFLIAFLWRIDEEKDGNLTLKFIDSYDITQPTISRSFKRMPRFTRGGLSVDVLSNLLSCPKLTAEYSE